MHITHPADSSDSPDSTHGDDVDGPDQVLNFDQSFLFGSQNSAPQTAFHQSVKSTHPEISREEFKIIDKQPRKVTEIRVYYDDQTYETFIPAKK
jgi:hypothetical protein